MNDFQSGKILEGENEHIQDFALAYELSWKAIENIINELATMSFPPQTSPQQARQYAESLFLKKLPPNSDQTTSVT